MEPFIGEIKMFAGNFAPRGWALCNGQILPISQNTALFSLLGTTYGGDGRSTFALPDLRGRVAMHPGDGPGLTPRDLGESSGSETVTLLNSEMPAHTHYLRASSSEGNSTSPENSVNAVYVDPNTLNPVALYSTNPDVNMNLSAISPSGGSQPHENLQPFLCVNYIIALEGIYPSRN